MNKSKYYRGVKVSLVAASNGQLSNHDFVDETLAEVTVEVAGGAKHSMCNIFLGTAMVEFSIDGCGAYKQVFPQDKVEGKWTVPAHKLNARVTALTSTSGDRSFVMDKLRSLTRDLNLVNIGDIEKHTDPDGQEENSLSRKSQQGDTTNAEVKAAEEGISTIRFQYNGVLTFNAAILDDKDKAGSCHPYEMNFPTSSKSFHVVAYGEKITLKLSLLQLILPDEDKKCAIVDSSTSVSILNGVGLSTTNPIEKRVIDQLQEDDNKAADLALYTKCSGVPCIRSVSAPTTSGDNRGEFGVPASEESVIEVKLMAGIPNTVASSDAEYPFSKQIVITAEGAIPHFLNVIVTGDLSEKPPRYVSFPVVKPFLVLRDPPGGSSYVGRLRRGPADAGRRRDSFLLVSGAD